MEIDFVINNKKMKAIFPVIEKEINEWKKMIKLFDPSVVILEERIINGK